MSFMWDNKKSGHQKVLFHFKWNRKTQNYFLNGGAYDHEEEVLLYDGATVVVESVEEVKAENGQVMYTQITLKNGNYKDEWPL